MPDEMNELRQEAMAHDRTLEASGVGSRVKFYTVQDLAARWSCSVSSVRAIPRKLLPYTPIGRGRKREHRRYNPDDVLAYESAHPKPGQGRASAA